MSIRNLFAGLVGLAIVAAVVLGAWHVWRQQQPLVCEISGRPIHRHMLVRARVDGKVLNACCARCAITLAQQTHHHVEILTVTDYSTGERLPADRAYFVDGSRVQVCAMPRVKLGEEHTPYTRLFDRCTPSLLAFTHEQDARDFIAANGGSLKRLDQLMQEEPAAPAPSPVGQAGERQHD